jgi:homoserine acetyltransferase
VFFLGFKIEALPSGRILLERSVNHLRLISGTSIGCMNSWVWGETYPDFTDALMADSQN